jgi:dolichyl-phosphate beta-glucosyltransferase
MAAMVRPALSVVIPAFNEANRIEGTLAAIHGHLSRRPATFEIIVVDDGSTDGTARRVEASGRPGVRLVAAGHGGKGAALRLGVAAARGERILLSDADLSAPIDQIARLEAALDRADIAVGSRGMADTEVLRRQPLPREFLGRCFNFLIGLLGVRGIRDTQCGFQLFRGDVGRDVYRRTTVDGFAATAEALWLAQAAGCRIAEVGIRWEHDPDSRVRVLRDGAVMVVDSLLFRWRHRRPGGERDRGPGRAERDGLDVERAALEERAPEDGRVRQREIRVAHQGGRVLKRNSFR